MLNKNGWGYQKFIVLGSILLIALIICSFFVIRLYSQLPDLNNMMSETLDYGSIESNISIAARNYYDEYYNENLGNGVLVVSTKNLLKYNILSDKDLVETSNNDSCSGYALLTSNENDELVADAYIKCKSYITSGYQNWRVVE